MEDDEEKPRFRAVPDVLAMAEQAGKRQYLVTKQLRNGDVLTVVTDHHRYSFQMLDAGRSYARMTSDNPDFPGPIDGCVQGSLLAPGGSTVMSCRVVLGHCVAFTMPAEELGHWPRELTLAPTKEVLLNGCKVLPAVAQETVH